MSDQERKTFETELIEDGLLLPIQPPGRKSRDNPFRIYASRIKDAADDKTVQDAVNQSADAAKEQRRKNAKAAPKRSAKKKTN